MGYRAGIDLGTTSTAAALWRDGDARPEVLTLGARAAAMPSVLFVDTDGTVLVGEPAEARAATDPTRVARWFKRNLGDPVPVLVGGTPWPPEHLLAHLLHAVVAHATRQEGRQPDALALTHPATWGAYKLEQLAGIARLANLDLPLSLTAEPVAAALHYAATLRMAPGSIVAVYDLGGGTFDATVLQLGTDGRPTILGRPEGIERLGGIDVDEAVFQHVRANAAHLFADLDEDDPVALAAMAQVRSACRAAKEALSEDTQASVVAAMPAGIAQVRISRNELENAIRPPVDRTVAVLSRAIGSAGLEPSQVDRILLVGGASRMPIVAAAVSGTMGRPVAVDADPKYAIALGAARRAATAIGRDRAPAPQPAPTDLSALPPPAPPAPPAPLPPRPSPPQPVPSRPARPVTAARRPSRRVVLGAIAAVVVGAATTAAALASREPSEPAATVAMPVVATIDTVAGIGLNDGAPATEAHLSFPTGVAVADDGTITIADLGHRRVRSVDPDGNIATLAGNGLPGRGRDGVLGDGDGLVSPTGTASGPGGVVLIADGSSGRVVSIGPDGTVVELHRSDNVVTDIGDLSVRSDVAFAPDGRILIADQLGNRVLSITSSGVVTVAGTGNIGFSGDNGPATAAHLANPTGVAAGADGTIVIADRANNRVRAVGPDGTITTIAGTGTAGFSGDGGPATAADLSRPSGVAVATDGTVLIADQSNHRIRAVATDGTITTIAGTGTAGFSGDGGPALDAQLNGPAGLALHPDGRLLVADTSNNRIRAVATDGSVATVAGTDGEIGDGADARTASVGTAAGVAAGADGSIVFAEPSNHRIRSVRPDGTITTIAGTGTAGFSGDGGPALDAQLRGPVGVASGPRGIVVVDTGNHRIRLVSPSGTIDEIAGTGTAGFSGDGGPAGEAQLNAPTDAAVAPDGTITFSDRGNHRVRQIDPSGTITTIAGTGTAGFSGDDGPAVEAELSGPTDVAVAGDLVFIADLDNNRVRLVTSTGTIRTLAGAGTIGSADGDGDPLAAEIRPTGLAIGPAGQIFIADSVQGRLFAVIPDDGGLRIGHIADVESINDLAMVGDRLVVTSKGRLTRVTFGA